MSTITAESKPAERWSRLDPRHLQQPAALVFNPNAGHKLGVDTNSSGGIDKLTGITAVWAAAPQVASLMPGVSLPSW